MKRYSQGVIRLILLLTLFLPIVSTGVCQIPYSSSKTENIQSVISKQISDPQVKKTVLKVLEDYPLLRAEKDTCEKLKAQYKTLSDLMGVKIVQLEAQRSKTVQDLEKTEALKEKYRQKLFRWRGGAFGAALAAAVVFFLTK